MSAIPHARRKSMMLQSVEAGAQPGADVDAPEGASRDRKPVKGAVGFRARLDDALAGSRRNQNV